MLRAIDLSRAAMLRQGQYLDTAAHNVANANTPGFKAIRAALETGDFEASGNPNLTTGTDTPPLTGRVNVARLFTQGDISASEFPTDMAIEGEGFFVVRRADGTEGYTRNGAFRTDGRGQLVDSAGNALVPGITLPPGVTALRLGPDGTLTAQTAMGEPRPVGRLQLARFANPNGLAVNADGVFTASAASGLAAYGAPGAPGFGRVRTGAIEGANVDITEQVTNLAATQRLYQMNTSAFRIEDEMLRLAATMGGG